MTTTPMSALIQHLRRTVLSPDGAGLTDGQLLEEYISRHDEAALAALVQRHAPMVWGVCRRVLGSYHDAEDAFQATFLVLVRKATSVRPRDMIANWLYGVARQTALKTRATVSTRKGREKLVMKMPDPAVAEPAEWVELLPLLDEELSHLPDQYRVVLVLCDLEGKTRKEVARQLCVPEGTVAGRVARARVMLANRLTQRGITLSSGALATILGQNVASASVPALVVSNTIKVANFWAAGQGAAPGVISVKVAALTEGVMQAMFLTKLKVVMAVVLVVGLVGAGTTSLLAFTQAREKATPMARSQTADEPKQTEVKKKLEGILKEVEANGGERLETLGEIEKAVKQMKEEAKKKKVGEKEAKVWTIEEALTELPKKEITVEFKVGKAVAVWATGATLGAALDPKNRDADQEITLIPAGDKVHDKFYVALTDKARSLKALGVSKKDEFVGKTVRVRGMVDATSRPVRPNTTGRMMVWDTDHIEVVK